MLGTAQFGLRYGVANKTGQVSRVEASKILDFALTSGIRYLDSAIGYGSSEEVLGGLGVSSFEITSKLTSIPNNCNEINDWVSAQTLSSISRLGIAKLKCMMLHAPQQLNSEVGPLIYEALLNLKRHGLVQNIGISVYDTDELKSLTESYSFDVVQVPVNVLDRRFVDSGLLSKLKNRGVEIHARSIFLQGLLLMSRDDIPNKFKPWQDCWAQWHAYLESNNLSPLIACLSFVKDVPEIDYAVVGVDTVCQLQEIISSVRVGTPKVPRFPLCKDIKLIDPRRWTSL